ncbi:protein IWS1 homolog 1-like isoform X2 [Phalaenopsis equestris]|uniref:protein IWS1 homolog 1-like isoform X2 n=1 Tax=Phalaenopsis equestris TaxID=78828 RepID=UPI0009E4F3E7|nr:protein IWS1 homolog 1-like isoform X2 [Phalaenopsis equestris]
MGYENDPNIDEGGEAFMDSYGAHSDRQPSHYTGNQLDIESGHEWRIEPSPTPAPVENKLGKQRKRLVNKSAAESLSERGGNPSGQAFGGDELNDWNEEEPENKRRSSSGEKGKELCVKMKSKVLSKESQVGAKASSSRSKGYGVGSADHEIDPELHKFWNNVAGHDLENRSIFNKRTRNEDLRSYEDERIPHKRTAPTRTANKSPEKDSLDNDIDEFSQRKKLHQTSLRERASLPEPLPLDFVVHPPSKVNWEEVRARAIRAAMKAKKDKMRRKRRRPFDPPVAQRRRPLFKVQSSAY